MVFIHVLVCNASQVDHKNPHAQQKKHKIIKQHFSLPVTKILMSSNQRNPEIEQANKTKNIPKQQNTQTFSIETK